MELDDRVGHISNVLHHFLPTDFRVATPIIMILLRALRQQDFPRRGLENIFLARYVGVFGMEYPHLSAALLDAIGESVGARFVDSELIIEGSVNRPA